MKESFYLTTTLPYVNAPLHLGHALEFIRADVIARYKEAAGYDVYFNTGTDEHGSKIYQKAEEQGLGPQVFVDQSFETFQKQLRSFGLTDQLHFIRTTNPNHVAAAQEFWRRVAENGFIYKKQYQAKYCVGCESEKTDSELVDGKCALHPGLELNFLDEENYFFKYSAFTEKLLAFYQANPTFVLPDFRFNELKSFVKGGLQDFSISRLKEKMPWGIPIPNDDNQVMYVWFDALVNYISTLGWPDNQTDFEHYWRDGKPVQYCGKDNLRFQGAMWQAMLMAADLPNSQQIVVNGFITGEGGIRMSKSLGNVINPQDLATEYGTDALRYFLLREVSNFEDSPFTLERFKEVYNAGLANGLGNLVSRIMKMAEGQPLGTIVKDELLPTDFSEALNSFDLVKAMNIIWEKIADLDKVIQETQPFKLVKSDPVNGALAITVLVLGLNRIAEMLNSFLPETSQKIQQLIKDNRAPNEPLFPRKD